MGLFTDGFKLLKKASEPLYKTPKSIQETIEIMAVAENGIFEVSKNKYSKCYRFQDINYTTATEDEQIGIFERYCKFLNSLDCNYKITINNKNKNMDDLRDKVLIAEKNDGFNNYRRIYNDIIEEKIIEAGEAEEPTQNRESLVYRCLKGCKLCLCSSKFFLSIVMSGISPAQSPSALNNLLLNDVIIDSSVIIEAIIFLSNQNLITEVIHIFVLIVDRNLIITVQRI